LIIDITFWQDTYDGVNVELPPLGLKLTKSASFLDLVHELYSKPKAARGQPATDNNIISKPSTKKVVISGAPKTSKFYPNFLKIGDWEVISDFLINYVYELLFRGFP
jgi:hypothetical protein